MVALWTAWRPAETVAVTPVVVSLAVLALVPWAHRRSDPDRLVLGLAMAGLVGLAAMASAAGGWDRANAVVEISLAASVVALAWVASRADPNETKYRVLAFGISALSVWAVWQVMVGFEVAQQAVGALPSALQSNAEERLASGRAFASLLLPGHLAALLATALPLLVTGIGRGVKSLPWAVGSLLCLVGLVLTRSPIGVGLAGIAILALLARRRTGLLVVGFAVLAVALVAVAVWRPDVGQLDPIRLRIDNWRTAWWAFTTSPLAGVGLGSFGQVIQTVPFKVGNLPAHAHSLPMEWLAEFGLVGLAAFMGATAWLVNLLRRIWSIRPELAVSLAVIPMHNLVDFSIYTSGVALPWAILLGWGMAVARPSGGDPQPGRGRTVLVTVAACAVAASLLHMTSRTLESAALVSEPVERQFDDAVRACRMAPWRSDPAPLAAAAALDSGDQILLDEAETLLSARRWLKPHSATLAEASGRVHFALGQVPFGAADIFLASRSQPVSAERRAAWESLLAQLEEEHERARR